MRRFAMGCSLLVISAVAVSAADRSEWTQWRGPQRLCTISAAAWPEKLDEASLVEMYRVPLEPSYSGPIVTKDKVFVTETVNKEKEIVRALTEPVSREKIATTLGMSEIPIKTPEQFAETVRTDIREWGAVIKGGNIKID